jgi:hypothetical protein
MLSLFRRPAAVRLRPRAFLLAAAVISVGVMVPAGASAASASPATSQEIFHTCQDFGKPSGGVTAVHCVDLLEENNNAFVGQNELFCQNTATKAIVDCQEIEEAVESASVQPEGTPITEKQNGICGTRAGHSDCGARRVINQAPPALLTDPGGGPCEAWAVTGDLITGIDLIILPNGTLELANDLGTQHISGACIN